MTRIAIIGGGISGVAAAFYLEQAGMAVDLYESESQLGGRIGCTKMQDRWVDTGGKNIGKNYTRFRALVKAINGPPMEPFGLHTSREHKGQRLTMGSSQSVLSNLSKLSRLAGWKGMLQLLPHLLALKLNPRNAFLDGPWYQTFARRHDPLTLADTFTKQCAGKVLRPLTVRMNGAEPDEYHPGNLGSNLGMVLDDYEQPQGGMHAVFKAYVRQVKRTHIHTRHQIRELHKTEQGFRLHIDHEGHIETRDYAQVMLALPAPSAAQLLRDDWPELAQQLDAIRYFPVSVAVVKYQQPVFKPQQRAKLFGAQHVMSNAGAYGPDDLDRVRYTLSGRVARQHIQAETPALEAIELAETQLGHQYADAEHRQDWVYRHLNPGLCAYNAQHARWHEQLRLQQSQVAGLGLCGDYLYGASIEACCESAYQSTQTWIKGGAFGCAQCSQID